MFVTVQVVTKITDETCHITVVINHNLTWVTFPSVKKNTPNKRKTKMPNEQGNFTEMCSYHRVRGTWSWVHGVNSTQFMVHYLSDNRGIMQILRSKGRGFESKVGHWYSWYLGWVYYQWGFCSINSTKPTWTATISTTVPNCPKLSRACFHFLKKLEDTRMVAVRTRFTPGNFVTPYYEQMYCFHIFVERLGAIFCYTRTFGQSIIPGVNKGPLYY